MAFVQTVRKSKRDKPRAAPARNVLTPFPEQEKFVNAVLSLDYHFMGYGGAVRGGKTLALVITFSFLCKMFPGSRWAIIRKDLPRLRRNTVPTIDRFAPQPFFGRLHKDTWSYRCANGSELLIMGEQLDRDPDLDRFKGLEVNGVGLEESNELAEETANKCKERLGSWIVQPSRANPTPVQPPALMLCTFNPSQNWVREWFYNPWSAGTLPPHYYYQPALPKDNPYNTQQQWDIWQTMPPEQYKRFIEGDWDAVVDPMQLLSYQHILDAAFVPRRPGIWRLGVDVATGGDSETGKHDDSAFVPVNGNIIDGRLIEKVNSKREPWVTARILQYIKGDVHAPNGERLPPIAAENIRIDNVGVGSGVYNTLREWGRQVKAFIAGAKPVMRFVSQPGATVRDPVTKKLTVQTTSVSSPYKFKDLRGQAWWEFADQVKAGEWCIVNPTKELVRDLTAVRFAFPENEKHIIISSTDDIKKVTHHSPDVGTGAVMAAFKWPVDSRQRSTGSRSVRTSV
jgi:hypothetical protein